MQHSPSITDVDRRSALSVCLAATADRPLGESLAMLRRIGADRFGVLAATMAGQGWNESVETIRASGLRPEFIAGGCRAMHDGGGWERVLSTLERAVDAAAEIGAPTCVSPPVDRAVSPGRRPRTRRWTGSSSARGVRAGTGRRSRAREHDVDPVGDELHPQCRGHRCAGPTVGSGAHGGPVFGLAGAGFDANHRRQPGRHSDRADRRSPRRRDVGAEPPGPGEGSIPLDRMVSEVGALGYTGLVDLELLGPVIDEEGPENAMARDWNGCGSTCRDPAAIGSKCFDTRGPEGTRARSRDAYEGWIDLSDKRMSEKEAVGRLRSGMTIGIGGWGSRRKTMSLVREILRSDLDDLTVVSYGGRTSACCARRARCARSCSGSCPWTRSHSILTSAPHVRADVSRSPSTTRACCSGGCTRPASDCRTCRRGRARIGRHACQPRIAHGHRPLRRRDPRRDAGDPARRALGHMNRADMHGNAQYLGPDLYFDDLFCMAAEHGVRLVRTPRADRRTHTPTRIRRRSGFPAAGVRRGGRARGRALHVVCAGLRPRRGVPAGVRTAARTRRSGRRSWTATWRSRRRSTSARCAARVRRLRHECSDAGGSVCGGVRRGVSRQRRGDRQCLRHHPGDRRPPRAAHVRTDLVVSDGEAAAVRGTWAVGGPADGEVEAWLPFNQIFDLVWNGKRHIMMIPTQLDVYGNCNISAIGDHERPNVQLLGVRGAPGNTPSTTRPAIGCPSTAPGCSCPRSTWCPASATTTRARRVRRPPVPRMRRVVTIWRSSTSRRTPAGCAWSPCIRGSPVDDVVAATGFDLVIPDSVPQTRTPSAEELELIRTVIDPRNLRDKEVPRVTTVESSRNALHTGSATCSA